jgi:hypothetical protein
MALRTLYQAGALVFWIIVCAVITLVLVSFTSKLERS